MRRLERGRPGSAHVGPGAQAGCAAGDRIARAAASCSPERTIRRVDAILAAREALEHSVAPLLAMEALLLELAERN